jgi:translation initiation factor IF-3
VIEQEPLQEGRNMSMLLAPTREAAASQAKAS